MARNCTTIRVRYADTDAGGVVYHANYIVWLEASRTEALRAHGVPYVELQEHGIHLPVIDLHVRYHQPALYDQLIEAWVHIAEITRTRVRFEYSLRPQGDTTHLATAHTVHAFMGARGRVLRMDRYPELWTRVLAAAEELRAPGE